MGKLDQRVAIVTGGGTGMGRNIALEFAKAGADVVVTSRNPANLERVAGEVKALGRHSLAVTTDVSVAEQVRNMVEKTLGTFGRIDILVNSAGVSQRTLIMAMPEEEWDSIIDINLKGVFLCTKAVAKYMIEQKYGKIINISSLLGVRATRWGMSAYSASKAGVIQLTKASALEFAYYGINVNCIAPGSIETDIYKRGRTAEQVKQWLEFAKKSPMRRVGTTQDIANLALFLASDESSFITGEIIIIDGGVNARM